MCQQCGNNICGGCQPIIPSGNNGVDGINAFNFTTASFTMPSVNSNVTVNVKATNPFKNSWFAIDQVVFIETAGYFQVVNITGSNQVTLKNLGYSDANFTPAPPATTIALNSKVSPSGLRGAAGATGNAGTNGTTRIAYLSGPILSGIGSPKTFITQTITAGNMPQTEGSSLLLTFNVKTDTYPPLRDALKSRLIGIRFGNQECIIGMDSNNLLPISVGKYEAQFKVEIIRGNNATVAYARVSVYGIEMTENLAICYNESNPLTGLNFANSNDFVIRGFQQASDTFIFTTLTVDKITV